MNFKEIKKGVNIVKEDLLKRFPGCAHTTRILLWDDGSFNIECRHGKIVGRRNMLYISTLYKNELTFKEIEVTGKVTVIDKHGNEQHKYLVDEV